MKVAFLYAGNDRIELAREARSRLQKQGDRPVVLRNPRYFDGLGRPHPLAVYFLEGDANEDQVRAACKEAEVPFEVVKAKGAKAPVKAKGAKA